MRGLWQRSVAESTAGELHSPFVQIRRGLATGCSARHVGVRSGPRCRRSAPLVIVGVDLSVLLPLVWELVLGEAGVDGARLDARVAVDALLGIDVELRLVV